MDVLTLIISVALVGGVLAFVLYPLWRQTHLEAISSVNRSGQTLEEYQARYEATLAAIKDLMFDYEMGKVSLEDYESLLNKTKLEAAEIRRQIDRLSQPTNLAIESVLDTKIEELVAQIKYNGLNSSESLLREVDAEIEILKTIDPEAIVDASVCPHCGKMFQTEDAFCSGCGQSLDELGITKDVREDVCPKCGHAFQSDDAFCAKCGTNLKKIVRSRSEKAMTQ